MSSMTGSSRFRGDKVPTGYQKGQLAQFTPEQMQLFQQLLGGAGPGLVGGLKSLSGLAAGDQSQFEQMEAPAMRQFSGTLGGIASRFSGIGSGSRRSSGFGNETTSAAQQFAEQLQSKRLGMQQQAIEQLLGLSGSLLGQKPYENFLAPKQKPAWQELLMSLFGGLGQAGGSLGTLYGAKKFGLLGE